MAVSMTDVRCLPPNSGDLRQAEAEHQGKIYSNGYKMCLCNVPATCHNALNCTNSLLIHLQKMHSISIWTR